MPPTSDDEDSDDEQEKATAKLYKAADLRALARGQLAFHGNARVRLELKKAARESRKQWDQMSLKHINKLLQRMSNSMTRKRRFLAADQFDSSKSHKPYMPPSITSLSPSRLQSAR